MINQELNIAILELFDEIQEMDVFKASLDFAEIKEGKLNDFIELKTVYLNDYVDNIQPIKGNNHKLIESDYDLIKDPIGVWSGPEYLIFATTNKIIENLENRLTAL